MAKVELKQPIVAEISELLDGAATAVVVDYRGLTVAQDTELRKQWIHTRFLSFDPYTLASNSSLLLVCIP